MDRLRQIEVFLEVARARSFTAAARRLGMSRANATKLVLALERQLGAPLLTRNTHHVAPTDAGLSLMEGGAGLLGAYEAMEAEVRQAMAAPRGTIRVGVPPAFGAAHLTPAVAAFTAAHPGIQVAMLFDHGNAELVRDGLDLSLRIAASLRDASYIAKLLARVPQVLVASPGYLARHGAPTDIADLAAHPCLVHVLKSPDGVWRFEDGSAVAVRGPLSADFGEALRAAALGGQGIAMHPAYMVEDDIRAGRLAVVLPGCGPVRLTIHAVYPQRNLPARVRAFIDFLGAWMAGQPTWSAAPFPSGKQPAAAVAAPGRAPAG